MGGWTVFLTNQGFRVIGLDISQRTIARLKDLLPDYQFVCGDVRQTEFADAFFDACFSWGVFEHFEQGLGSPIAEAWRVLKPGGLLFVSVPYQNWRHIFRDARTVEKWDENLKLTDGHVVPLRFYQWRLTKPELWRELEMRGFKVHHVYAIHRKEGVRRMLPLDFKLEPGTLAYRFLLRLFSRILPASLVAHMIMAVAEKKVQ
jgi:SAM-dependent methyltransferase